jgi:hypothetical protein
MWLLPILQGGKNNMTDPKDNEPRAEIDDAAMQSSETDERPNRDVEPPEYILSINSRHPVGESQREGEEEE